MKGTDRAVLISLLVAVVLAGFYITVLSPKRKEASKLGDEVSRLESSILEQEQVAAYAEDARRQFPRYYGRMVVLGKAVPAQADSASLLVQVNSISTRSSTSFTSLALGQGSGTTTAPAVTAPAAPAPADAAAPGSETTPAPAVGSTPTSTSASAPASGQSAGAAAPAPATETVAATLPIGATVGPAGLPTLPYDLLFKGSFFQVADFIAGVDGMVHTREASGQVVVDGRLLTIDGFSLQGGRPGSDPELDASFAVTSYVMPSDQGLTLGASPGAPAQPQTTPATATVTP